MTGMDDVLSAKFTKDQLEEIELGLKDDVDVSFYAKEEFLAIQMRQIRIGLLSGVRVSVYSDPTFDWFQMEELRLGLENHVNVEKYKNPQLSYRKMREIRKGLMAGIDLSNQAGKQPEVLRQIRKAYVDRVDISKYVEEKYNPGQLREIRKALVEGLKIDDYVSVEYRGSALHELIKGLQSGVDVSVYADPNYSWRQMREIRLGLENQLDVSRYSNNYYDWQQMRQIRQGLLVGLDVSSYAKFSLTAKEMERIRRKIENVAFNLIPDEVDEKDDISDSEKKTGAVYVGVIEGGTKATLNAQKGTIYTKESIEEVLNSAGITYGKLEDVIEKLDGKEADGNPCIIAVGKKPVNGKDGKYDFMFDTKPSRKPKETEDGYLDFANVDWYETVEEDQALAKYTPATEGVSGITVTGEAIEARNGVEQKVITGKGFVKSEDGNVYIAEVTGIVEFNEEKMIMNVSNCLEVEEVTNVSGNIKFEGNVRVKGNVGVGANIYATDDVIVDGFVEACTIVSEGNVILKNGANGKAGRSLIKAKKQVLGKFFENMTIEADELIQANYCLHCDIYTKGKLDLSNRNGLLLGGHAIVEEKLNANNIGNKLATPTSIVVGMNDRYQKVGRIVLEKIKNVKKELEILQNACEEFQNKYPPEIRNAMEIYMKIENAIYTKQLELQGLEDEKEVYNKRVKELMSSRIDVRNHLYEGVKFELNGRIWNSEKKYNVSLYRDATSIIVSEN